MRSIVDAQLLGSCMSLCTDLREAQLEEMAFQLLQATSDRAPDAATGAVVQDAVRRALQVAYCPPIATSPVH